MVYVCLEGEAGLTNRIAAYGLDNAKGADVHFITQPLDLQNEKDVVELAKAIKENYAEDGVVILDTLNRAAPGMDENSSSDMGTVISLTKQLQTVVGGLVILVHHTGKDASKGMRGHSSLFAALDASIEVCRSGDQREWKVAKAKDGEDGKVHPFRLEVVSLGFDDDGDAVTSCVIKPADKGAQAASKPLSQLERQGMDSFMAAAALKIETNDRRVHAHADGWRDEFYRVSTADSINGKKKAFQRVRNQLVEIGKLVVNDDVYSLPSGFSI